MKHFISLVLGGVMPAVSVTFSSPTVTDETEHHDNVLIATIIWVRFGRSVLKQLNRKDKYK